MAQAGFALTLNQALPGDGKYSVDQAATPPDPTAAVATQAALLVTAKSAVGTVVTDDTAAFTALDIFGNALVAVTGDSYSNSTHQWTTGGSTGLTHAQVATLMALLNTAITDFKASQAAALTAQTDTNLVTLAGVTTDLASDAVVLLRTTKFTKKNQVRVALRALESYALASSLFTA
jgi:hypothetical protein